MIWPVSSGRENAGADAPTVKGAAPSCAGDLVTRFTVFWGVAAPTEVELFLVTERALEVFFLEDEESFDLAFGELLEIFGLGFVDELFLDELDLALDGIYPPAWEMNDDEHGKSVSF